MKNKIIVLFGFSLTSLYLCGDFRKFPESYEKDEKITITVDVGFDLFGSICLCR